ncbi:MAG: GNAT family N-acetyltransferase [Lachnospiraceae bacterium]|nr:GNAT family N-acetyltransferase [Lachnospiraceae bacterium]
MMNDIKTDRLIIHPANIEFTDQVLDYYVRNREFFSFAEPYHPDSYYTIDSIRETLAVESVKMYKNAGCYFYAALKDEPDKIIFSASFANLRGKPYFSTIFGYDLDEKYQRHGYATEACKATIEALLKNLRIHRIEARVLLDNQKSINILENLGFEKEGIEKQGIYIKGQFQDHIRYAYINKDFTMY